MPDRRTLLIAAGLGLLLPAGASAAPADDKQEVKRVVEAVLELNRKGRINTPEGRELLAGEALSRWTEPTIGTIEGTPDAVTIVRPGFAACRVTVTAPTGDRTDLYFYAAKKPVWKVVSMRVLSLTGSLYSIREGLRAATTPPKDGGYQLRNVELTLMSDQELKSWFNKNHAQMDALLKARTSKERAKLSRTLGVMDAEPAEGGAVRVTIGGILDNTVGFLFQPKGAPPTIDPSDHIWVEPLGRGWYLFRTT